MPDITSLRERLRVPASRTLPNGTPYHTLPVIQDAKTGALLGDSFETALYLDRNYPDGPKLFHPLTTGLTAAFTAQVDSIFTKHAALCNYMPFDPQSEEKIHDIFARRASVKSWDDLQMSDEQKDGLMVSFEADLSELSKACRHTGGTTDHVWRLGGTASAQSQRPPPGREQAGPFLDGDGPTYADFIVGPWLKMMEASLKPEQWARVRTWQDGLWGGVVDALSPWCEIK